MKLLKHRIIESAPGVFRVQALVKRRFRSPAWEGCLFTRTANGRDHQKQYGSAESAEKDFSQLFEKLNFKTRVVKEIELGEEE